MYHRTYLSYHLEEISFYENARERDAGSSDVARSCHRCGHDISWSGAGRPPVGFDRARGHISIQYTRLYVSSYVNVSSSL